MARTKQSRMMATPTYRFDIASIPESDWISMGDGERLPGKPHRQTLYTWTRIGAVVPGMPDGFRLKLPTFRRNGRRYTTRLAYNWWMDQQQEQQ